MSENSIVLAGIDILGIQRYVFRGSRLREIVGGSHLVDLFTSDLPFEVAKEAGLRVSEDAGSLATGDWRPLRTAGGKVRARFADRQAATTWAASLTEAMLETAPGLDFVAAVVDGETDEVRALSALHERLERKRASQGGRRGFSGFPFTAPCKTTCDAAAGYGRDTNERLSEEMLAKQSHAHDAAGDLLRELRDAVTNSTVLGDALGSIGVDQPLRWPLDLQELLPNEAQNAYMGVICFDGNAVGERIRSLCSQGSDASSRLAAFSEGISRATRAALKSAIEDVLHLIHRNDAMPRCTGRLPVRVLLEGGDDVVVVIRPDLALPFAISLADRFEQETGANPAVGRLTAGVGVAITKSKAPILSGVELAGSLLEEAKDAGRDKSRLSFMLVSSSLPSSLSTERARNGRSEDGHRMTQWPRSTADSRELLSRAEFVARDLPRGQVRGAVDACRRSRADANAEFERLRDVVLRDLAGFGDWQSRSETLQSLWPTGWFHDEGSVAATDLKDCLDLARFIPTGSDSRRKTEVTA